MPGDSLEEVGFAKPNPAMDKQRIIGVGMGGDLLGCGNSQVIGGAIDKIGKCHAWVKETTTRVILIGIHWAVAVFCLIGIGIPFATDHGLAGQIIGGE